jgi:hypothetical protein
MEHSQHKGLFDYQHVRIYVVTISAPLGSEELRENIGDVVANRSCQRGSSRRRSPQEKQHP